MKPGELLKPTLETSSEAFLERHLPGSSPSIIRLRQRVMQLNSSRNAALVRVILIVGESGAGKNHLARVIAGHRRWLEVRQSPSENPGLDAGLGPFIDYFSEIHLPALPDTLIESELFGYKKGAFTDAKEDRPGLLGGPGKSRKEYKDLLLDEIGDASPSVQAKLLQVIESGRSRPLGGGFDEYYTTSARMLMATNRDLAALAKTGQFREDLLWRLQEFIITVPPLRDQFENIEPLARHFGAELKAKLPEDLERDKAPTLTTQDLEWARSYEWPGNVRELRQAVIRWTFEEGGVSLKDVVAQRRAESTTPLANLPAAVTGLVRARLEDSLQGKSEPPGSLDALAREFEKYIKEAASSWHRTARPTDEQLRHLFGKSKLVSIKNKFSAWRKQ